MDSGGTDAWFNYLNGTGDAATAFSFVQSQTHVASSYGNINFSDQDFDETVMAEILVPETFDLMVWMNVESRAYTTDTNVYSVANFLNTAHVSYSGPDGSTTYSASGLFPGTVSMPTSEVPEPDSLMLSAIALFGIWCLRSAAGAYCRRPIGIKKL